LGSGSNSLRTNEFFGTQVTDSINGTGTSLQDVHIYNSRLGSNTVLNISEIHLYYSIIGSTLYRNFSRNLGLTLTGDAVGVNTTVISDAIAYTKTVSATINANTSTALISDQAASNIWASGFTTAVASISNKFNPGLILTVTPATTASTDFFCVIATNTTASNITLTNAALKVLFFSGTGMAI
jgi:hypothetical protein